MNLTTARLSELEQPARDALRDGLVLVLPGHVKDDATPHKHGCVEAVRQQLVTGYDQGSAEVVCASVAVLGIVCVWDGATLRQRHGIDPYRVWQRISSVVAQGPDSAPARKLIADAHPLPDSELLVLDVTDDAFPQAAAA